MPVISGFGSGTTSLDQEVRKEDDRRELKRASRRKTFQAWKDQKLKDRQTISPEDMYHEKLLITGGDNLQSSYISERAADAATASVFNQDVAEKLRQDVVQKVETLNKTTKAVTDSMDPNTKTYKKFARKVADTYFAGQMPDFKGEDDETIPPKLKEFLSTARMDDEKWQELRGTLRTAKIDKIAQSETFKNSINQVDQIKTQYEHLAPWEIDGLKTYFTNNKIKTDTEAIIAVKATMAGKQWTDIENVSDDAFRNYAMMLIDNQFPNGDGPTGTKLSNLVEQQVTYFKNQRSAKIQATKTASTKKFAALWSGNEILKNLMKTTASGYSAMDEPAFRNQVKTMSVEAGLGEDYFDFATRREDSMAKLKQLVGENPFRTLLKAIIINQDALAQKVSFEAAAKAAKDEETRHGALTDSIYLEHRVGEYDQKLWGDGGSVEATMIQIGTQAMVPFAVLDRTMEEVAKRIENGEKAPAIAIDLLNKNKHWKSWDQQKAVHRQKRVQHISVKHGTNPVAQSEILFEEVENILTHYLEKIQDAPMSDYSLTPEHEGWVGDFQIDKVRQDWKKYIDLRRKRLKATFGNPKYRPMWAIDWKRKGYEPDGDGGLREKMGQGEGVAPIRSMESLYNYALARLNKEESDGLIRINSEKPTGQEVDRGRKLKGLGLTSIQEQTIVPFAKQASTSVSSTLTIPGNNAAGIDPRDGLTLEMFIPPNANKKTNYKIPLSMMNNKGQIQIAVLENKAIMDLAIKADKLHPQHPQKAMKLIRNLLLFGGRDADSGNINQKMNANPFFRSSARKMDPKRPDYRGPKGKARWLRQTNTADLDRMPTPDLFKSILKGEDGALYDMKLGVLMDGEKHFYFRLLQHAQNQAAKAAANP
jgi:hypothetical protein|tara:strand:+ start:779 stop:3406 length:2628 start_codon:yes stop_codon:yes gene_type:complete